MSQGPSPDPKGPNTPAADIGSPAPTGAPRTDLLRAIRALAAALPSQMEGLLDSPRFKAGREALARLADPVYAARAVEQMNEEEAASLTARLYERWQRIGAVVLPREAMIVAPREIWAVQDPQHVSIEAVAHGVDDDWVAVWTGPVLEGPPSKSATLVVRPPDAGQTTTVHVRAHVRARARGERCILIAEADIAVHRGPRPAD